MPTDGPRLVSSDVFDTAVFRLVGRPRSAFSLLGERLRASGAWSGEVRQFAVQRAQAEVTSRADAVGGEPSLTGIYADLGRSPFLHDPEGALEAELDLERQLILPSSAHRAALDEARASGARVCFVSDTYLSSSFLREILGDLARPGESIYASCEVGASKHAGTVFDRVLDREGVRPGEVLHLGDDRRADGTMARRHGWTVRLCEEPVLNRYERELERHALATRGVTSLLAGASRVVRVDPSSNGAPPVLRSVTTSVAAPVLLGFVSWTLDTARKAGCDRVAYVAPAGQILCDIAERLQRRRPPSERLRTHVVHDPAVVGSRGALVDLGWREPPAASLNPSAEGPGPPAPLRLYFGLRRADAELLRSGGWMTYTPSGPGLGGEVEQWGGAPATLLDELCRDGEGTRPTILEVVDRVAPFVVELGGEPVRAALTEVLRLFLMEPDRAEGRARRR